MIALAMIFMGYGLMIWEFGWMGILAVTVHIVVMSASLVPCRIKRATNEEKRLSDQ